MGRTIVLGLLISTTLFGRSEGLSPGEAKSFLGKNRRCYLAVALKVQGRMSDTVLCFENLTLRPGSMDASNGCTLTSYTLTTNEYSMEYLPWSIPHQVKKSCEKGGLSAVLDEPVQGTDITSRGSIRSYPVKTEIVYAAETKASEIWNGK